MNSTGIVNFREISSDVSSRPRIFRAGILGPLPQPTVDALVDNDIRYHIDLRSLAEIDRDAHSERRYTVDLLHHNFPINYDVRSIFREKDVTSESIAQTYFDIVISNSQRICDALDFMVSAKFNMLVSCRLGKDRTGIVIALYSDIVGISRNKIINDYQDSLYMLRSEIDLLKNEWVRRGITRDEYLSRLRADPDVILYLLRSIDQRFGSVKSFWRNSRSPSASH